MKVKEILFTDESQQSVIVHYEGGESVVLSYPPATPDEQKLLEEYGGYFAIFERSKQVSAAMEALESKYEMIFKVEGVLANAQFIDFILNMEYDREDLLKQKMQVFTNEDVIKCTDKNLLTKLRKAESLCEILTYYGMIKLGIKEAE